MRFNAELSHAHTEGVSWRMTVTGGTATNGVDAQHIEAAGLIPAGRSGTFIRIWTTQDDIAEGTETLEFELSLATGETDAVLGTTATLTIREDSCRP